MWRYLDGEPPPKKETIKCIVLCITFGIANKNHGNRLGSLVFLLNNKILTFCDLFAFTESIGF